MVEDDSFTAAKYTIAITLIVILVVAGGLIWITGIIVGILVLLTLAIVAGVLGNRWGTSPTAVTSASFIWLYTKTLIKEFPVALRRMVMPVFITVGLWYFLSLSSFLVLAGSRMERTGQPDFAGFSGWINDTNRVAGIIVIAVALYQLRHIIVSVATIFTGQEGLSETTIALGAREATRKELDGIIASLEEIRGRKSRSIIVPNEWMVLDAPIANHYTIGRTVYLTTALLDSTHRTAGMLHAMGHIKNGDGIILLALRRLIAPLPYHYGIDRRVMPPGVISGGGMGGGSGTQTVARAAEIELADRMKGVEYAEDFARRYGGIGLLIYGLHWASFWRERVFLADRFVKECGYDKELIDYLQEYEVFDVAQPFLSRGRPYTRERIDRLEIMPPTTAVSNVVAVEEEADEDDETWELESDLALIDEHSRELSEIATEAYQTHGRGFILFDTTIPFEDEGSVQYVLQKQMTEIEKAKVGDMVANYTAELEMVVVLEKPEHHMQGYIVEKHRNDSQDGETHSR